MSADRQRGSALIWLIVTIVLLLGSIGFGVWAFMSRQDYKDNSDQKSAAAAAEERTKTQEEDAVKYAEEAKNPLKAYVGPSQYGNLNVLYPKTWSGYVEQVDKSNTPLSGYFHPDVVPGIDQKESSFALRIEVDDQAYDQVLRTYKGSVDAGRLASAPYSFPKVSDVVGTRFDGQIEQNKQGSLIVMPMRNLTLEVWTESGDYLSDFNNIILPNLSFSP
jgi:hypothetical protein